MARLMYENRFILTRKLHKEYFRYCYRRFQKKTQGIALLLALLSLGVSAYLWLGLHFIPGAAVGLVLALYFVFVIFFGYAFREWLRYRELQDLHGKAVVNLVRFHSDQVHVTVNKTKFTFKYSTICRAYETEDLLILILGKKGMLEHGQPLYKRGFTGDTTPEDFKRYINQKTGKDIFADGETEQPRRKKQKKQKK